MKSTRIKLGKRWKQMTPEGQEKHKCFKPYYDENKAEIDKQLGIIEDTSKEKKGGK